MLTRRTQLDAGSLRKALHAEVAQQSVRDAQLLARFDIATFSAQPLTVDQVRSGEIDTQGRRCQPIDGVAIQGVRSVTIAQQRA